MAKEERARRGRKKGKGRTPKRNHINLLTSPSEGVYVKATLGGYRVIALASAFDLRLRRSGRSGIRKCGKKRGVQETCKCCEHTGPASVDISYSL